MMETGYYMIKYIMEISYVKKKKQLRKSSQYVTIAKNFRIVFIQSPIVLRHWKWQSNHY